MTDEEIKQLANSIGEAVGAQIMLHVDRPDLTEIEELLTSVNEKLDKLIELTEEAGHP